MKVKNSLFLEYVACLLLVTLLGINLINHWQSEIHLRLLKEAFFPPSLVSFFFPLMDTSEYNRWAAQGADRFFMLNNLSMSFLGIRNARCSTVCNDIIACDPGMWIINHKALWSSVRVNRKSSAIQRCCIPGLFLTLLEKDEKQELAQPWECG